MAMVDGMLLVAGETIATDRLTENLDVKDRDPARSQLAAWYAKSGGGTQSLWSKLSLPRRWQFPCQYHQVLGRLPFVGPVR
jgi:hypothetical protein